MFDRLPDPDTGAKLVTAAASVPLTQYVVPMWGAPISAFGLAALGAFMAYGWEEPERSKRVLIFKSLSVTCFSVAIVMVMPDVFGVQLSPEAQPPMAFIIATFGKSIILALRRASPIAARAIAGMFGARASGYDRYDRYDENEDDVQDESPNRKKSRKTNEPPEGY